MSKELDLQDIHHVTLDVLKEIMAICEKYQIRYYVMFGSLIGAIRHHGFIPWDDDFDIIMLRPDYEKFCSVCQDRLPADSPYKLMNKKTTQGYPFNISRFCDTRYRMVRDENEPDAGMGIFIDIYPFDGVGSSTVSRYFMRFCKNFLLRMIAIAESNRIGTKSGNALKTCIKFPLYLFTRLTGPNMYYKALEKLTHLFSLKDSKYIDMVVWGNWMRVYRKEWFAKTVKLPFEGLMVDAPAEYDAVLRSIYGDYMQLPPEEEQKPSHFYKIYKKD